VSLRERTNARYLEPGALGPGIKFCIHGCVFYLRHVVLPAVLGAVKEKPGSPLEAVVVEAVILVKPQFEAGREQVGKGGIVHDPAAHQFAIDRVRSAVQDLGANQTESRIPPSRRRRGRRRSRRGSEGNREFLLYARFKCFSPIAYTKKPPCDLLPSFPSRRRKSWPPFSPSSLPGCGRMTLSPFWTT